MKKSPLYHLFIFTTITLSLSLLTSPLSAQEMQTDTDYLDVGDISVGYHENDTQEPVTITNPETSQTSGQLSDNENGLTTSDFSLTLKETIIDYGELIAANPVSRTNAISVRNTAVPYYSLVLYKDHQLRDEIGNTIADTTCDNGACTETRSAPWTSPLVYGFGYRCDDTESMVCDIVFVNKNVFKQIPDAEQQESYQPLLHGNKSTLPAHASVTFQVNTAASQPKGNYTNTISYILVPGL